MPLNTAHHLSALGDSFEAREPPQWLVGCYAKVGMTLAHVAGGEETAGIRGAHEVGDAGAGVVPFAAQSRIETPA
ncbi:hypothetical protein MRX96_031154 [Rhipicephalus microplus]